MIVNSRVGLLSDIPTNNRFDATIKNIVTVSREFKNRQKFSAKSGLLGFLTETANQWDLHQTLSGSGTVIINILFTADGSQQFPFIQPYIDIFFGGTSDANRPDPLSFSWSSGSNFAIVGDYLLYDTTYAADNLRYSWMVDFDYNGTFDYYLKAYTMGSSPGTLTITRTL